MKPTTAPTTKPTSPPATESVDISSLPRYEWNHPQTPEVFTYRPAVQADVLGLDYQVTSNDIVIEKAWHGCGGEWFPVPAYMDGKRVVAIGTQAFEYTPEYLYLPKTLLALHSDAFGEDGARCLYVSGEILAVEGNIKFHNYLFTTKTCVDQYGKKFSELTNWKEWSAKTYIYRTAGPDDVGDANYQNTAGDIIITSIECPTPDYVYDIPAYIDGKKVVALGKNVFARTSAEVVYVPATVKCIAEYGLSHCMNPADIYFRGENIYIEKRPFGYREGGITLHCSATCYNPGSGYYKDLAAVYGGTWKEWNG